MSTTVLSPTPVSTMPGPKLGSPPPASSSSMRRRHARDDKRGELLVDAYERKLREGPSSLIRPPVQRLPSDDPINFIRYSVAEKHTPPTYDEHGRQLQFCETIRQRNGRDEFLRRRKVKTAFEHQMKSNSFGAPCKTSSRRSRSLKHEQAALTIQRAFRAYRAYVDLTSTGARVDDILRRTRDANTSVRIEHLHALIAELGAISAVLDRSPLTSNDTRVLQAARRAAVSVRLALEEAESDASISSDSSSGSDDGIDAPPCTESDDEANVWVYTPRVAHVQSCLDLSAADDFDEKESRSPLATGASGDVSDSDSESETSVQVRVTEKEELKDALTDAVSAVDSDSDCTIENFHVSPSGDVLSSSSPSSSPSQTSTTDAEAKAAERLEALATFFSGSNRRWAGQPGVTFPPPKCTRHRSSCAKPPPSKLYTIVE